MQIMTRYKELQLEQYEEICKQGQVGKLHAMWVGCKKYVLDEK